MPSLSLHMLAQAFVRLFVVMFRSVLLTRDIISFESSIWDVSRGAEGYLSS